MNFEEERNWLAKGITNDDDKESALLRQVSSLQAADPDRAWKVAQGIKYNRLRESVLRNIVVEVARSNPDQAESLARKIVSTDLRGSALNNIAALNPSRAERLRDEVKRMNHELSPDRFPYP